jgi:hypothetical protein
VNRLDRNIAFGLFLLVAVTYGWFHGGAGWNQDAHFDLTRALVERGTLFIDGYAANTADTATGSSGHLYINKPPGISFIAAVPYAVVFAVEKHWQLPVEDLARCNAWIVTAMSCGLCGALIAPLLYLHGRRRMGASPAAALWVAIAIAFGTIVFPYSTVLFAHVSAALFLLIAVILFEERPMLAGAAAGMATACFYVCGVAALILVIAAMKRSRIAALRFVIGGVPFAVLLAIYHQRCFGSPFRTAVEASTGFTQKGLLFGVLTVPDLGALYGISFSAYRGLFFVSPVLLFAAIGAAYLISSRDLLLRRTILAITGMFFLVNASFNGWAGGCAFGPRYLLAVVPLLGILMMAGYDRVPRLLRVVWVAALLLSAGINFIATATDPIPCNTVGEPVQHYLVPAFFTGRIPEETRRAYPWYPTRNVGNIALPAGSGNLGEIWFGRRNRASLLPIVIWMIGGSALLFAASRRFPAAPR